MSPEARERSFDALATGLASGSISRGKALKLMGAALVGGALGSLGIGEAAADLCKRNGKVCKKDEQCCSGNCDDSNTCAAACASNGGTCSTSGDCCSSNCSNGFCCASGRVGLSNGTCALPCGDPSQVCPVCSSVGLARCRAADAGGNFCSGDPIAPCAPDGSCPTGQFCDGTNCFVAC